MHIIALIVIIVSTLLCFSPLLPENTFKILIKGFKIKNTIRKYHKEYHLWFEGDEIELHYVRNNKDMYEVTTFIMVANSKDALIVKLKGGDEIVFYIDSIQDTKEDYFIHYFNNISLRKRELSKVTDNIKESFKAYHKVRNDM